MQEQLQKRYNMIVDSWKNLEKSQKIKIITAIIVFIITIGIFLYITLKPQMVVLTRDLSLSQVGEVQSVLEDAGIYNEPTNDGVLVKSEDSRRAEILLASSNVPDSGRFTYESALSNSGMGTTNSIKRENLLKAKETYISEGLESLDGVEKAKVTLVVPEVNSFFVNDAPDSTAAVVLTTTGEISKNEATGMARYVANSVEGLELENVNIIDQNSETIFSGEQMTDGSASMMYDQELLRKNEIETKAKSQLLPLFSDVKITTNLVLDNSNEKTYRETYDNPTGEDGVTGFITQEGSEEQSVINDSSGEEPGVYSNDGQANNYQMEDGENSSADLSKEQRDYLYNVTKTTSDSGAGNIIQNESSMSVIAYNYKNYDEKTLRENNTLEDLNLTWEQYKDSIQNERIDIDEGVVDSIIMGTGIENVSIVGYEVPIFTDEIIEPINTQQIIMYIVLALLIIILSIGLIRNSREEEIIEIEPELSVEDLLVSSQVEEEREIERLKEIEFDSDNESKKQIDKFVSDKPEAVAQLLRNWLSDDWE